MIEPTDTGGAAFPRPFSKSPSGTRCFEKQDGMTLRDYFAAQLMPQVWALHQPFNDYDCARMAYRISDAMLRARDA